MAGSSGLISDGMARRIVDTAAQIAVTSGADTVSVRRILKTLGITNRVFYNRFHNVEEVLILVYREMTMKVRESVMARFDPAGDFFSQVIEIVSATLTLSYRNKMRFNQYVFAQDSASEENYAWWRTKIRKLIEFGQASGNLRQDLDVDAMSYAIWCFIRGYNADALDREMPEAEAIRIFQYSFSRLLDGMRAEGNAGRADKEGEVPKSGMGTQ